MSADDNPYQSPQPHERVESGGDSTIRISRTKNYADRVRAYRINIDGVERARIKAGTTVDIPVDAGRHTVVIKIDWCGSPTVDVTTHLGETLTMECGSNLPGLRIFLAIFYVFLSPNQYLTLTES